MPNRVPIAAISGMELVPTENAQIARVRLLDKNASKTLPWDRFVRLRATADYVRSQKHAVTRLLDVGGYDGALALFLEDFEIDLLDPETTGGTVTAIGVADRSYDFVTAIDVLEHIAPDERTTALSECARVASKHMVLNYPCQDSAEAQELVLKLTGNQFVRQHVEWQLPNTAWVVSELEQHGFSCTVTPHTSVAIWLGQYVLQNLQLEAACSVNRYLVEHHASEPFGVPLYHLVAAVRK